MRSCLPLIQKDSVTHMYGLAVYVKEGLPFPRDLSLEKSCRFLLLFLTGFTSFGVLLLFPLLITFVCMHGLWCYFINPSTDVFIFGEFNMHHKDCGTYFGGTRRPGELCYNFPISNDLTQTVNFPT